MRTDPFYSSTLSQSISSLTGQQNTLTAQLSSGLRVSSADVDPTAAAQSVRLGSAIAQNDAYVSAASGVESRLQASDSALGSVVTQLSSAISLAVEGSNGTLTSSQVKDVSTQLAAIRDEVVSLANSSYAGSYLFGGTSSQAAPFSTDTTVSPATVTYKGDSGSQTMQTPTGQTIATSIPGSAIFSASGADVLGSLNRLITTFASGAASSSTTDDLNELRAGLDTVSSQRGTLGSALSAITAASSYASAQSTTFSAAQSTLVSADMAAVATSLATSETQQKALLSVVSSTASTSLFEYMNR